MLIVFKNTACMGNVCGGNENVYNDAMVRSGGGGFGGSGSSWDGGWRRI